MIKFLKFVPVQLTFFLVMGIFTAHQFSFRTNHLIITLCLFMGFFFIIYKFTNKQFRTSGIFFTIFYFSITFFIGVGSITFKTQTLQFYKLPNFGTEQYSTAVICIQKKLNPTNYYYKYEAIVKRYNHQKTSGKILVNIQKESQEKELEVGDQLAINSIFKEPPVPLNPYSFNYKKYLKNRQIMYQVFLDDSSIFLFGEPEKDSYYYADKIRSTILNSLIKNGFKNDELALINALLLGDRRNLSRELMEDYTGAGAVHILAVSGLHVGIIMLLLTFLFKPLHQFKNGKRIASIFIVLSLWMFAVLAGISASVVRAVTMFTALTIGIHLNRPSNIYNTLIISLFFLLLVHPFYLFEVGFQLSYLAVFSIVWIQPKLSKIWSPRWLILDKIWQIFTVSLAAQIGVLPLSLYYFHQFPGLFFISNIVLIPFLGIILMLGVLIIIASVLDLLPHFLAETYIFMLQKMNFFVSWIGNQEYFIIRNITFSMLLMLSLYAFLFILFKWIEKMRIYRLYLMLIAVIMIQIIFLYEKFTLESTDEFIVFNKSKSTIFGRRNGDQLTLSTSNDSFDNYVLRPYITGSNIENIIMERPNNLIQFKNEIILVVDSLGIYNFKTIKPSIIILRQSPKINLDRLLQQLSPKLIISDGSNYKSDAEKWKQTCAKNNIPFYNTMQKGAYILK